MPVLFIVFVIVPIVEIAVLIRVGSLLGVLPTVSLVILTAAIGVVLLRQQGLSALARAQDKLQRGEAPVTEMIEGVCLAIGGALLLTPGFVTDAIGFFCLIPGLRQVILGRLLRSWIVVRPAHSRPNPGDSGAGRTLEGEYRRED